MSEAAETTDETTEKDGANRYREARRLGVTDKAIALRLSPEENDRLAKLAEDHVDQLLGAEGARCLTRLLSKDGHADDADFLLWDGRTVDVKHTTYPQGRLLVQVDQRPKDIYILVYGTAEDDLEIMGWAERADVESCLRDDLGHIQTYGLDQMHLRTMEYFPTPSSDQSSAA